MTDSSPPPTTMPSAGQKEAAVSSAERSSSVTAPPSPPVAGAAIARAQTFPFNFHSIRSKSPRPVLGPVQGGQSSVSHQGTEALHKTSKQAKRTSSEPSVPPLSPKSQKRPSLARSNVSSTSHHGRHSNEWLFGGFSVRETVKGVWKGHEGKEK